MGKNEFKIRKLRDKLSAYEGFVLYGAGYLSRLFMDESAEDKITPFYCVVTKREDNPIEVNGISVYTLEQKEEELRQRNILIVVAVTYPLETEIIHFLHKKGIANVAAISECRWNPFGKTFRELYLDKDFNWYVPRIKDWYYEQNGEELDIFSLIHNKNGEENTVLFVIENLLLYL